MEDFWALRDLSFEVKHGEVVGVIGANGAGKSTLLKLLSRITEPTAGWADIRGRVGSLLEVGTGFHPELTGRENIYLNGAILGMRRAEIERRFDEIVAFAEVESSSITAVKHYSTAVPAARLLRRGASWSPKSCSWTRCSPSATRRSRRSAWGRWRTSRPRDGPCSSSATTWRRQGAVSDGGGPQERRARFRGPVVEGVARYPRGVAGGKPWAVPRAAPASARYA